MKEMKKILSLLNWCSGHDLHTVVVLVLFIFLALSSERYLLLYPISVTDVHFPISRNVRSAIWLIRFIDIIGRLDHES